MHPLKKRNYVDPAVSEVMPSEVRRALEEMKLKLVHLGQKKSLLPLALAIIVIGIQFSSSFDNRVSAWKCKRCSFLSRTRGSSSVLDNPWLAESRHF